MELPIGKNRNINYACGIWVAKSTPNMVVLTGRYMEVYHSWGNIYEIMVSMGKSPMNLKSFKKT